MAAGIVLEDSGLHQITATVRWQANSTGARSVIVSVEREGVTLKERRVTQAPTEGGVAWQQAMMQHIAEPGDVVVVKVRQTSGLTLDAVALDTTLDIARLAQ